VRSVLGKHNEQFVVLGDNTGENNIRAFNPFAPASGVVPRDPWFEMPPTLEKRFRPLENNGSPCPREAATGCRTGGLFG
jgi:hypothetical protein